MSPILPHSNIWQYRVLQEPNQDWFIIIISTDEQNEQFIQHAGSFMLGILSNINLGISPGPSNHSYFFITYHFTSFPPMVAVQAFGMVTSGSIQLSEPHVAYELRPLQMLERHGCCCYLFTVAANAAFTPSPGYRLSSATGRKPQFSHPLSPSNIPVSWQCRSHLPGLFSLQASCSITHSTFP